MHTISSPSTAADEEYTLPCVEALLAGTLALMTGMAQAAPDCAHKAPMARKIADNLRLLAEQTQLSEPMRMMLRRLLGHWQQALADARPAPPSALWAPVPPRVQ